MKSGTAVNNVIMNAAIIAVRKIDTHFFVFLSVFHMLALR